MNPNGFSGTASSCPQKPLRLDTRILPHIYYHLLISSGLSHSVIERTVGAVDIGCQWCMQGRLRGSNPH